jgi:hypothetical protein
MTVRLPTEDLQWQEIDGDIVVLDGRRAAYLTPNGSRALLWRMLATNTTLDDLVAVLVGAYEVDEATVRAPADAFLCALSEQGLLAA